MKTKTTVLSIFLVFFLFGGIFAQDGELPGDANCDGAVNVLDVITISQYFIGYELNPFCFENADVNGDGAINVLDIVLTVDIFADDDPGDGTVTDIDGNVYQTVVIGSQEWMAENLRVTRDASGNDITRYCYDDDPDWCELYGGLYTWYTIMNGESSRSSNPSSVQGICPTGWHVPSDAEWAELLNYLDSQGFPNSNLTGGAGNALKSCRQLFSPLEGCNTSEHPRWNSHNIHYGIDEFGYSALPGGSRWPDGSSHYLATLGTWWSSTEHSSSRAWRRSMSRTFGNVDRLSDNKGISFSLRCVRD